MNSKKGIFLRWTTLFRQFSCFNVIYLHRGNYLHPGKICKKISLIHICFCQFSEFHYQSQFCTFYGFLGFILYGNRLVEVLFLWICFQMAFHDFKFFGRFCPSSSLKYFVSFLHYFTQIDQQKITTIKFSEFKPIFEFHYNKKRSSCPSSTPLIFFFFADNKRIFAALNGCQITVWSARVGQKYWKIMLRIQKLKNYVH